MTVDTSAAGLAAWRDNCLLVAGRLLEMGRPSPVSVARLDQILAAARDGGMSEMEQGVMVLMLVDAEVERRGWGKHLPRKKRLAMSTAFAMRMLQNR